MVVGNTDIFSGWWLLDTLFLLPEPSMGAIYLLPANAGRNFMYGLAMAGKPT